MIFQHTLDKVLSGEKTQTRRLVKDGDGLTTPLAIGIVGPDRGRVVHTVPSYRLPPHGFKNIYSIVNGSRVVYAVGETYAAQPGRGQKSVARIQITSVRYEDVRKISSEDVRAEGFVFKVDFISTWTQMHDKPAWGYFGCDLGGIHYKSEVVPDWITEKWMNYIQHRPAERYRAWVIEFKLVTDASR